MGSSAKSYLLTLLLCVSVINEISLPSVNCQEEGQESQCLPRKTFFALLRLPEVSSNLAAYSRTARIIQDAKNRNEIVHLKGSSSSEDVDDAEICLPVNVYLDLFSDPAMRRHLTAVGRAQRLFEEPAGRSYFDEDALLDSASENVDEAKRSIATLAKNGDLPITLQDKTQEEEEEEEKRSASLKRDELEALVEELYNGKTWTGKRNVASLARDFALPPTTGKRNVGALARDFALPRSGKRYLESYALPFDKRNIAALARDFALPSTGKRNIAALARDYSLPSGKRYLDMFARNGMPRAQGYDQGSKRNFAALVRSGNLPVNFKKNVGSLARDWSLPTQNRFGRSLDAKPQLQARDDERFWDERKSINGDSAAFSYGHPKLSTDANEKKLEALASTGNTMLNSDGTLATGSEEHKNKTPKKMNGEKRPKRQIDFNDEYPLPVMQNANILDYEEMIEALADEYQNTEKRFMAADLGWQEIEEDDEPFYTPPPAKRHIGALARLGWLPSFRSARFSRSPRYLVTREDSADGPAADNSSNTPTRSLGIGLRNHYVPSESFGDCRHGFKRYLLVPAADKIYLPKFYPNLKTA